ncbi:MAG: LacI family DNA-binding transcriptional regulator [Fusicatenibacter sp.]|nr:LacI family DNA-binding transcriptional regulator [Fusicatenibacter sp.]
MKVTIKQIAELAGVSRGTVDRALNNRPGVKKEVQERIQKIALDLGYKPNPAAKALADNRYNTKKIGVILNSEGNPFFGEVMRGVEEALDTFEEFGLKSSIKTMKGYNTDLQIRLIDQLVSEHVQGIVLTPINTPEIIWKINELKKHRIEVVTINSDLLDSDRMAYVGCEYRKSGTVAAGLMGMMNRGTKERYAIIGSSEKNLAVEQRIYGIRETIRQDFPWIEITDIIQNEDSDRISYTLVSELLQNRKDLDGICFAGAGNEGGMKAVLESGRKLNIFAFDLTEPIRKGLKDEKVIAAICQEPYKQGYEGTEILAKYLLWNEKPENERNHTELSIVTKYCV